MHASEAPQQHMPWRFIGLGAAFISALFVWDAVREQPHTLVDQAMLGAVTTPLAAEELVEEYDDEPVFDAEPPPRRVVEAPPEPPQEVEVQVETTQTVVTPVVAVVEAPPPQKLVIRVQRGPERVEPYPPLRGATGIGYGSGPPFTPPRFTPPGGGLRPRSAPPRSRTARRRTASRNTVGGSGGSTRRTPRRRLPVR